jgi:hypothetical protein
MIEIKELGKNVLRAALRYSRELDALGQNAPAVHGQAESELREAADALRVAIVSVSKGEVQTDIDEELSR